MKHLLNPLIEHAACRAFGVDQYPDVFERIAMGGRRSPIVQRLFSHKVSADIRSHKLLFIHIPKNGGTSIKRVLYRDDPGHATVRFYDVFGAEVLCSSASFALLRDPVDRFLSAFDFLQQGGGSDVTVRPAALRRLAGIDTIDAFLDYLEAIRGNWFKVDTVARPQWWYVADRDGTIRVGKFWLLGEHNAAINRFLASYNAPAIGHVNRTARSQRQLTAGQTQRVESLYAPDFELYAQVRRQPGIGGMELQRVLPSGMRLVPQL
ncbi:MAG: hypothetical protein B7Z08_06225 [Sphingomonadales bacterium 32-68-7]|nr:MAG: hypothetical protein B7Z33_08135 [Sphingomonadales bacterium 12-68-11]OYX09198.1 MAG: hypothetical protein B7Z08_06225 [Sphingomonadales bacterium 32-68-7]